MQVTLGDPPLVGVVHLQFLLQHKQQFRTPVALQTLGNLLLTGLNPRITECGQLPWIAFARDVYTYLHLPMIVGIVLFAFAMKTTLAHVGDELSIVPALGLCGGPALYLLAYVGLRFRVSHTIRGGRFVAAVACAALVSVALVMPAIAALALVAAVWLALHAYELIWWRAARAETRAGRVPASAS